MIHKEVGILNDGDLIFNTRIDTDGVTDGLRRTERETEKLSGTAQTALGILRRMLPEILQMR